MAGNSIANNRATADSDMRRFVDKLGLGDVVPDGRGGLTVESASGGPKPTAKLADSMIDTMSGLYDQLASELGEAPTADNLPMRGAAQETAVMSQSSNSVGPVRATGTTPGFDPAAIASNLDSATADIKTAYKATQDWIPQRQAQLDEFQAERQSQLETSVAAKRTINERISGAVTSLRDRSLPVFQVRQRLSDQLVKLATMNPLERGIRGIFDHNYDSNYLEGQANQLDQALGVARSDFNQLTALESAAERAIDSTYSNNLALTQLKGQELDEDGQLINQTLSNAMTGLDVLSKELSGQAQFVQTQALMRDSIISGKSPGERAQLYAQAAKSGGYVAIDGVNLRAEDIHQYVLKDQEQELAIESRNLAIQGQRMNIAQMHEQKLVRTMTLPQVQQAIANGGVYRGVKLDQSELTNTLQGHLQRQQMLGENALSQSDYGQLGQAAVGIMRNIQGVAHRMQGLGMRGNDPGVRNMGLKITENSASMVEITNQIAAAKQANAGPQIVKALTDRLVGVQQSFQQGLDNAALEMTGGDKQGAQYLKPYLVGGDMSPENASDAMLYWAKKGGIPTAARGSNAARAGFAKAQTILNDETQRARARGGKISQQEIDRAVRVRLTKELPEAANAQGLNSLLANVPKIAKASGMNLGISPQDYQRAMIMGDQEGMQAIAQQAGIPVEQAQMLFAGRLPKTTPNYQALEAKRTELSPALQTAQSAAFLRYLDQAPGASVDNRPSRQLVSLLRSSKFIETATRMEDNIAGASYGDYLLGGMGKGGLAATASSWGQGLERVQLNREQGWQNSSRELARKYNNDPWTRTAIVLGAIPGLNKAEEVQLMKALRSNLPIDSKMQAGRDVGIAMQAIDPSEPSDMMTEQNSRITSALKSGKFQDPGLERIRKVAAANWDQYTPVAESVIDRYTRIGLDAVSKMIKP